MANSLDGILSMFGSDRSTPEDFNNMYEAFSEKYGYSLELAVQMRGHLSRIKEKNSYKNYCGKVDSNPEWFNFVKNVFLSSDFFELDGADQVESSTELSNIMNCSFMPPYSRDVIKWLLFSVFCDAEFTFAEDWIKGRKREETLTGALLGCASTTSDQWEWIAHNILQELEYELKVFGLDLQIGDREMPTGGDIVIITDIPKSRHSREIIPIILQSKKFRTEMVELKKKNSDGTYQYDVLNNRPFPSAYMFFRAHRDIAHGHQLPPLVKDTSAINYNKTSTSTSAFDNSQSLSTYIMHAIKSAAPESRFATKRDALDAIVGNIRIEELSDIIVFSASNNPIQEYDAEWDNVLQPLKHNNGNTPI